MSARQLSDEYLVLLRHGDTERRFGGDGSRVVGAIVLHAVNNKVPKAGVYKMLADPQNKGGFTCLRRRRPNLERWFDGVWNGAQRQVADHPLIHDQSEAVYRATELLETVIRDQRFIGRGGATDIAVFRAVITICQRVGRVGNVGISRRELAEMARINSRTASRCLRRLVDRGLIRLVTPSDGRHPSTYSLVLGATRAPHSLLHQQVGHEWGVGVAPSDAWRWGGGLGLSTARTFAILDDEAKFASAIAEVLGVHRRTTQRHLARLAEHGLAERTDEGWIRGDADLEHVAHDLGVAGAIFVQRRDHKEDRRRYRGDPSTVVDPETGEIHQLRNVTPSPSRQEGVA